MKKYDDVWSFEDGFARVKLNDKWGFIDETGNEYIVDTIEEAKNLKFQELMDSI